MDDLIDSIRGKDEITDIVIDTYLAMADSLTEEDIPMLRGKMATLRVVMRRISRHYNSVTRSDKSP